MNTKPESLSTYISRVKTERSLSLRQIEENSGGAITAGYINDLIQEKTKNPSAKKIKALARGLRVAEDELFSIVRGEGSSKKNDEDPRLQIINLRFSLLSPDDKAKAGIAIDALDAYLDRLEKTPQASNKVFNDSEQPEDFPLAARFAKLYRDWSKIEDPEEKELLLTTFEKIKDGDAKLTPPLAASLEKTRKRG